MDKTPDGITKQHGRELNQPRDIRDFPSGYLTCQHCGTCDAFLPSIEEQMADIMEWFDFAAVADYEAFRYKGPRARDVQALREYLQTALADVVERVRKKCDEMQISQSSGFEIWVSRGVLNVRYVIAAIGWMP